MGLFEIFPYTNMQQLNIDWVIDVCKRAEKTMKHLNTTIENVVRPMINDYENFVKQYYNQLSIQLNAGITKVENENKLLQQKVNRQLFQNQTLINGTLKQVDVLNRENRILTELSVSELRNDVNNLIAKYNAIWGANASSQDAKVKKIITDFSRKYDQMYADNLDNMEQLVKYVSRETLALKNELTITVDALNVQMGEVKQYADNVSRETLVKLVDLGNEIIASVNADKADLDMLYANIKDLFDSYYNFLDIKIGRKADLIYVNSEIARLEAMITKMKDDIIVINPVTSKPDTLQNTLNDLYIKNNPMQLTAQEYDDLRLSANQYDKISGEGMTASEYDDRGKWWLIMQNGIIDIANAYTDETARKLNEYYIPWITDIETENNERWEFVQKCCKEIHLQLEYLMYMPSPFDGVRRPLRDVILQMFTWIQTDTLTAVEYDAKGLDANGYDALMLTAYDYDWHGATLVV